jgi:hypothetical protein
MTSPDFDPEAARLNALSALRAWTRQRVRMPEQRARLLVAAWRAGERNVRELARIADVSRQTIYDDLRSQGIDPREDRGAAVAPPRYTPLTYEQVDDLAEHMATVLGPAMLAAQPEPLASAAWWAAKAIRHIANLLKPQPPADADQRGSRADSFDTISDCAARIRRAVHTQWAAETNRAELARVTELATQTRVELGESLPVETATVTVLLPDGMAKVPVTLTTAWRNEIEPDGFWQWIADAPLPLGRLTGTLHLEINALLTNLSELITQALHPELLESRRRGVTVPDLSQARAVLVVEPSDVPVVRDLATARGVAVEEVPERGIEPVSTATLVLVGVAAAISGVRQALERRKGGQMIDLRPGAKKLAYRTADLQYGIVVIVAWDGTVTVRIDKPDDVFEKVISSLPKLLPGGASTKQAVHAVEETLGSDAEVETDEKTDEETDDLSSDIER